jgi:hypothetical protein
MPELELLVLVELVGFVVEGDDAEWPLSGAAEEEGAVRLLGEGRTTFEEVDSALRLREVTNDDDDDAAAAAAAVDADEGFPPRWI